MNLIVRNPITDIEMQVEAQPENYNGKDGWRIHLTDNKTIFVTECDNQWYAMDCCKDDVESSLINNIGTSIKVYANSDNQA
jgi:hypothetical protein